MLTQDRPVEVTTETEYAGHVNRVGRRPGAGPRRSEQRAPWTKVGVGLCDVGAPLAVDGPLFPMTPAFTSPRAVPAAIDREAPPRPPPLAGSGWTATGPIESPRSRTEGSWSVSPKRRGMPGRPGRAGLDLPSPAASTRAADGRRRSTQVRSRRAAPPSPFPSTSHAPALDDAQLWALTTPITTRSTHGAFPDWATPRGADPRIPRGGVRWGAERVGAFELWEAP